MAHGVLDIVPENPEVEHVAAEMQKTSMQKHRGDQGQQRPGNPVDGLRHGRIEKIAGHKAEREKERLSIPLAEGELPQEGCDAGENNSPGHEWPKPRWVFVRDRNHWGTGARRSMVASSRVSE